LPTRFSFKGFAIGASGHFTFPFNDRIEVQAASALPEIGGFGSAKVVHFNFHDIIRFDVAQTTVVGSSNGCRDDASVHTTLLQSSIERVDVMGMLTADRVVARLMSSHKDGETEPSVQLIGTRFENLKIAGIPVEVDLATDLLDRIPKYSDLNNAYNDAACEDNEEVRKLFGTPEVRERWFRHPPRSESLPKRGSLVRSLTPESPGLKCEGHVIVVPGVGTIRLAEIRINPLTRIVNMVEIKFDCPWKCDMMMCAVEDGGSPW
jgi:hypothetical protein